MFKLIAEALRPVAFVGLSAWAALHRILPSGSSAEPGRWSNDRAPYLTAIMDALSPDHPCCHVVAMMPTQSGKTEVGNNWVCYIIDHQPAPMMMVLPTVDMAKDHSKTRIALTIAAMPELKDRVGEAKSRDSQNAIQLKMFPGGFLHLGGANSAASLSSKPIKYLYLDEVDRYPMDVDGEGDPVDLAQKRNTNFSGAKTYKSSTPVDEQTSRIEPAYKASNRQRYHVPCPHCGAYQVLLWESVKWDQIPGEFRAVHGSIYYECEACKGRIMEHHKTAMLKDGRWIAEAPEITDIQGFWINAIYAPVGWVSWADLVAEWLEIQRTNDNSKLKTFLNTRLAQTWKQPGEKVEHSALFQRREPYQLVPDAVAVLTAGIDTQDNRFEVTVYGWGENEECWGIVHEIVAGDTSVPPNLADPHNAWSKLLRFLGETFPAESGAHLPIWESAIDTQGHQTKNAAEFLRLVAGRKHKIRGISGSPTAKTFLTKPGDQNKYRMQLWSIGVSIAKETLHGRLKMTAPGGGYLHFSERFGESFFRQLTSERLVTVHDKNGQPRKEWRKPDHMRNEALDCWVYAYAAYSILNPNIPAFFEYNRRMVGAGKSFPGQATGTDAEVRRKRRVRSEGIKR